MTTAATNETKGMSKYALKQHRLNTEADYGTTYTPGVVIEHVEEKPAEQPKTSKRVENLKAKAVELATAITLAQRRIDKMKEELRIIVARVDRLEKGGTA